MVNWASVWTYTLIFGYLLLLIVSLSRWHGLRLAIKKHANTLLLLLIFAIVFVAVGGLEALVGIIGFSLFLAMTLTMIAGPIGFVLGLLMGAGISIIVVLYQIVS